MSLFRQISTRYLPVALILCIPFLLHAQSTNRTRKRPHNASGQVSTAGQPGGTDFKAIGSPMPPLRVVYPKKAVYTGESLKNDANLFVMMFNPTCEHCEEMAIDMTKNIGLFQKSHVVLVAASGMGEHLEFFENGTKLPNYPKIKIGVDSSNFINNTFTYQPLPQINVYDADRRLIKVFTGITSVELLRPYIQ